MFQYEVVVHLVLTIPQVMAKARGELNVTAAGSDVLCEFKVWEDHWVQCAKELNQWDLLLEYANSKGRILHYLSTQLSVSPLEWHAVNEFDFSLLQ